MKCFTGKDVKSKFQECFFIVLILFIHVLASKFRKSFEEILKFLCHSLFVFQYSHSTLAFKIEFWLIFSSTASMGEVYEELLGKFRLHFWRCFWVIEHDSSVNGFSKKNVNVFVILEFCKVKEYWPKVAKVYKIISYVKYWQICIKFCQNTI